VGEGEGGDAGPGEGEETMRDELSDEESRPKKKESERELF